MILEKQIKLAHDFQELHKKEMFVLPNIWDGGSARIYEKQGFPSLATTSAGLAYSMGYCDGQELPLSLLVNQVRQICSVISLPLSVDMERGYGASASEVKASVKSIIEAGAVGVNIEDGYDETPPYVENLDVQIAKIKALVSLREEMKIPFVINGRTCLYWLQVGDEKDRLNQSIKRCNAYLEAGADCVPLFRAHSIRIP